RALGSYRSTDAAAALTEAVASGRRHLVLAAIESLGQIGPAARHAAGVLQTLATADGQPPALRAAATQALTDIDPSTAGSVADRLAVSPDWRLRVAAARAAARLDGPGARIVGAALHDGDPRVVAA